MDRKEFLAQLGIGGAGIFAAACMQSCSKSSAAPTNIDFQLDLSTTTYASLKTPGSYVIVQGVIVALSTTNTYLAVSAACPHEGSFRDAWEVFGIGTIFTNAKGPQIHIHGSMGKKLKVLTGCVRGKSEVFLVIEAVVFELKGVKATKSTDPRTGLNLLKIL